MSNWPLIRPEPDDQMLFAPYPSSVSQPLRLLANGHPPAPSHPWHLLDKPAFGPIQAHQPFMSNSGNRWFHIVHGFAKGCVIMEATLNTRPTQIIFIMVPRTWVSLYEHEDVMYMKSQLLLNSVDCPLSPDKSNDLRQQVLHRNSMQRQSQM
ncbi:hypothetical protein CERSUDRAFT_95812 [Gelatoporia subvermispora B]|uniref:Uncharacterized protein n=1 Tax=Ceriporiopsis subvermispora (strain B) TaxID=914234 RepID=M2QWL6_CERS8|nr:hypothetical protein CERSUDRAFT_95812 [Gelatoporia subvermispora B]